MRAIDCSPTAYCLIGIDCCRCLERALDAALRAEGRDEFRRTVEPNWSTPPR